MWLCIDYLRMVVATLRDVIQAWDMDPTDPRLDGRHCTQSQALPVWPDQRRVGANRAEITILKRSLKRWLFMTYVPQDICP